MTMTRSTPVQADLLLRTTVPETAIPEAIQATVLQLMAQLLIEELRVATEPRDQHEVVDDE